MAAEMWRSKLNNKYFKSDIESWDKTSKDELKALRKMSGNGHCFDCGSADTSWASPKLGIFICVSCSDVHRATGAHITCVKNFSTYLWGPDELELMKAVGNKRGKELYGNSSVDPFEQKERKVAACTKKYGKADVQELIQRHVRDATEKAKLGPSKGSLTSGEKVSNEKPACEVTKISTDFFDFGGLEWPSEPRAGNAGYAVFPSSTSPEVAKALPEPLELEDFFACSTKDASDLEVKKIPAHSSGLDDLIFADFGKW